MAVDFSFGFTILCATLCLHRMLETSRLFMSENNMSLGEGYESLGPVPDSEFKPIMGYSNGGCTSFMRTCVYSCVNMWMCCSGMGSRNSRAWNYTTYYHCSFCYPYEKVMNRVAHDERVFAGT